MEFSKKNFTHFLHSKNMAFTKNLCIGFFLWQSLSLGMLRSDLMLETHPCSTFSPFCCWKQVEINTIASGFGWMGPASGLIHRYIFLNFLLRNRPPLCVFLIILPSIFLWFRLLLHMDYYSVFLLFFGRGSMRCAKNFDLLLESKVNQFHIK